MSSNKNMCNFFKNKWVKITVLLMALLYSAYEYSWGQWLPDDYYWINISRSWHENPLVILYLWSMNRWYEYFGYTLIANRILGMLLCSATLLSAYFLLVPSNKYSHYWYYLCGAFLIMGPGIEKICTPDCHTSLLVLLLAISVINRNRFGNKGLWIMTLASFTAISVSVRFPNLVCILFVAAYMFMCEINNKKKGLSMIFAYIVISISLYYVIMVLALGTFDAGGEVLNSFQNTAGESNGRHSIIGLFLRYCKSILLFIPAGIILYVVWYILKRYDKAKKIYLNAIIVIGSAILFYEFYSRIGNGHHSWMVCFSNFTALSLLYCAYLEWRQHNHITMWQYVFITMMLFVPSAGSDTGFQKSMILACAMAPYVIYQLRNHHVDGHYVAITFTIVMLTSVLIFNERARYHLYTTDIKPMQHILWERWQIEAKEQLNKKVLLYYKENCTDFYGLGAHYLYCLTNTEMPLNTFWMEQNDSVMINRITESMERYGRTILIDLTKSDSTLFTSQNLIWQAEEPQFCVYTKVK